MRVLTVVGARPQFIKAAPVSRVLRKRHEEYVVHTGQHYDAAMSADFFAELDLGEPNVNLRVGSSTHGAQVGAMLSGLEAVLLERQPDGVVVYGDTNSTLAGALAASTCVYSGGRRPWLVHVEAGLRSFNWNMAEERNRVASDHLADLLLAPTANAMAQLAHEGLGERAELVGDVMADAVCWGVERSAGNLPEPAASSPSYLLLTLHRAENVDDPRRLATLLDALPDDRPVLFPVHPRTARVLSANRLSMPSNVRTMAPVGYLAMLALENSAAAILTDSGGVQKEAYLAGVPCITLRTETEWEETVDAGWNRVAGYDPDVLDKALHDPNFMNRSRPRPQLFGDGHAAERVVTAMEHLHEGRQPKRRT